MKSEQVRCKERGKPGFQAIGEGERSGFNGAMITSVVGKHESRNVKFPVQGGLIDKGRKLLSDGFVANLCLTVALGMVA